MSKYKTTHLSPSEIDRLRFKAFATNGQEDMAAYYRAASLYFQERDVRAMNRADRIEELEAQIAAMEEGLTAVHMAGYRDGQKAAEAKLAKAMTGLNSIASNTCCDKCQEAALVARTTLAELKGQGDGQAPHAG